MGSIPKPCNYPGCVTVVSVDKRVARNDALCKEHRHVYHGSRIKRQLYIDYRNGQLEADDFLEAVGNLHIKSKVKAKPRLERLLWLPNDIHQCFFCPLPNRQPCRDSMIAWCRDNSKHRKEYKLAERII